jgi:hypothetical protein
VQSVTGVVKAFGALPQPVQGGVVAITGLVAVVGLIGGAMLLAIPKIVAFKPRSPPSGSPGWVSGRGSAVAARSSPASPPSGPGSRRWRSRAPRRRSRSTSQPAMDKAIRKFKASVDKLFGAAGSTMDLGGSGLAASLRGLGNGSFWSDSGRRSSSTG